ncbi:hypothetical protein ACWD4O_21380 [Streptomyces sp. NPDC002623]
MDHDDIVLVIAHPFGDVERSLADWIARGPGRPYVRPVRARSRTTGEELPLTVIPLRYRNTRAARRAIREGRFPNPWPRTWPMPSQEEEDATDASPFSRPASDDAYENDAYENDDGS